MRRYEGDDTMPRYGVGDRRKKKTYKKWSRNPCTRHAPTVCHDALAPPRWRTLAFFALSVGTDSRPIYRDKIRACSHPSPLHLHADLRLSAARDERPISKSLSACFCWRYNHNRPCLV